MDFIAWLLFVFMFMCKFMAFNFIFVVCNCVPCVIIFSVQSFGQLCLFKSASQIKLDWIGILSVLKKHTLCKVLTYLFYHSFTLQPNRKKKKKSCTVCG